MLFRIRHRSFLHKQLRNNILNMRYMYDNINVVQTEKADSIGT